MLAGADITLGIQDGMILGTVHLMDGDGDQEVTIQVGVIHTMDGVTTATGATTTIGVMVIGDTDTGVADMDTGEVDMDMHTMTEETVLEEASEDIVQVDATLLQEDQHRVADIAVRVLAQQIQDAILREEVLQQREMLQ